MFLLEDHKNGKKILSLQQRGKLTFFNNRSSWEYRGNYEGKLNKISSNPKDLSEGTSVWIICGPAQIHEILLKQI